MLANIPLRIKKCRLPLIILGLTAILGAVLGPYFGATPSPAPLVAAPAQPADIAWILVASGLVLFMTPGLAFFYGGMVHRKNVISTMLQSYIAMGAVSILWIVLGFSLAFGESFHGLIGNPLSYIFFRGVGEATHPDLSPTIPLALFALFQMKFAIITPALTTGAFAERIRFSSYLLFLALFTLFIYAPLAHWTWHPQGFLRQWGVLDFAGGTVVHLSAGLAALVGALSLGRRKTHLEKHEHQASNIPFILLGTGMLWFGWYGFNAGSALGANSTAVTAFLTTHSAAAAGMLAWLFFDIAKGRRPSATGAALGSVVGLVAITPAAGYVSVSSSFLIGMIAAIVSNLAVAFKSKTNVDDTLDVFPSHGIGAIVGMIATAIFAKDVGLIAGQTHTLIVHIKALVLVAAYCLLGSWILFKIVNRILPMRVSEDAEAVGLDEAQHQESYLIPMLSDLGLTELGKTNRHPEGKSYRPPLASRNPANPASSRRNAKAVDDASKIEAT